MDPVDLLAQHRDRLTHIEHQPSREPHTAAWPAWIDPEIRAVFAASGIQDLWSHQRRALDLLADGRDVIVTTGTASGKSLIFTAPALQALAQGRQGSSLDGHRAPTVLYLAPTKALAADQLRRLRPSANLVRPATVDGDNSTEERTWAREHARYVLTNPDTLHHTLLPGHQQWSRLLRGLRYVVVDECHHYRGIFGAHVAHVLRRLQRICAHYGAAPQFILSSATIAEPENFATLLTGRELPAITEDGSAQPARTIALWEPPLIATAHSSQPPMRRSAASEAAQVMADLVSSGTATLTFVRSRRGAEQIAKLSQDLLSEVHPELTGRIATYRGGYLPEERRELERRLRSGELIGLASTNALELGIDISGLDAVVTVGFPRTRAAFFQQIGRAGRTAHEALGVFIAGDDPLETYLVHHPEALLGRPVEATVFDPENPYVLGPHLAAAAAELPLTEAELPLFGDRAWEGVQALTEAGWLRRRPSGWYWTRREKASGLADLRSSGGAPVQIVDAATGRLIGTVDAGSADTDVHTGAVCIHQGEVHVVQDYAIDDAVATVRVEDPGFTTSASSHTEVAIVQTDRSHHWGPATISTGTVDVTSQVNGFTRRSADGSLLSEEPLDLPQRVLRTRAVWWTLDRLAVDAAFGDAAPEPGSSGAGRAGSSWARSGGAGSVAWDSNSGDLAVSNSASPGSVDSGGVAGAAHAAEHAAIGMLPLLATCDRWDIGGLSTAHHPDTEKLTVFVYDGHRGGAGFAERGFEVAAHWLSVTREAIASCECTNGCPSCVYSPKCGNGNEPLDKQGAVVLLDALLAQTAPVDDPAPPLGDRPGAGEAGARARTER